MDDESGKAGLTHVPGSRTTPAFFQSTLCHRPWTRGNLRCTSAQGVFQREYMNLECLSGPKCAGDMLQHPTPLIRFRFTPELS